MNDFPKDNLGLIDGLSAPEPSQGAQYEVRLPSGDWRPHITIEDKQYSNNTDTMACISFSDINDLEIQNNFLTGQSVNFSDRFIAKLSGTTKQGNYVDKVANTVMQYGLVLDSQWPTPQNFTWDSYYSAIPQNVISKAIKVDISAQSIPFDVASLQYHLKQCPIQITIPGHAIVLLHIEGNTAYYFDTYPPYVKTMDVSKITFAYKIVLNKGVNMAQIQTANIKGTEGIFIEASTPDEFQTLCKVFGKDASKPDITIN
jgi:hypothetical protein